MAGAEAYCVEIGRKVTILQARYYYFQQPEPRRRLTFLCGDDRCRAISRPLVIGENYHKEENSPEKKKSPCFRENTHHLHIANCNWLSAIGGGTISKTRDHNLRSSLVCAELGLVFRPYPSNKKKVHDGGNDIQPTYTGPNKPSTPGGPGGSGLSRKRPETNPFMTTVAMLHLNFTAEQKRKTPLAIEGYADGTFHNICNWVGIYHPDFCTRRIYYGRCKVEALDLVMMIKFRGKISQIGDRDQRTMPVEICLSKAKLNNESIDFLTSLQTLSDLKEEAWCYFFSHAKPKVTEFIPKKNWTGKTVARFSVASLDHIAVIPTSELTAPELAKDES